MAWYGDIVMAREAHLRAALAEYRGEWHLVVRDYLICLEAAERAEDHRATCFFAAKLVTAYTAIGFHDKAERYRELAGLAQG